MEKTGGPSPLHLIDRIITASDGLVNVIRHGRLLMSLLVSCHPTGCQVALVESWLERLSRVDRHQDHLSRRKKNKRMKKKGSDHHQRHYRCENPSCPAVKQEATTLITDHTATIAHKLLARQKMGLTSSSESGLPFIFESMLWYLSDGGRINDKHQRTRLEPRKEHRKGVSPWAKCNRTKAMTKDSPVRTRFLANRSTRHSRTLLLTVKPASHKIGRRL